jgi:hypothetical protein
MTSAAQGATSPIRQDQAPVGVAGAGIAAAQTALAAIADGVAAPQRRELSNTTCASLALLAENGIIPPDVDTRFAVGQFMRHRWYYRWREEVQAPAVRPAWPFAVKKFIESSVGPNASFSVVGTARNLTWALLHRADQGADLDPESRDLLGRHMQAAWDRFHRYSEPSGMFTPEEARALIQLALDDSPLATVEAALLATQAEKTAAQAEAAQAEWFAEREMFAAETAAMRAAAHREFDARQAQGPQEPLVVDFRPIAADPQARTGTASCGSIFFLFTAIWVTGLVLWGKGGTETVKKLGQVAFSACLPLSACIASYSRGPENREIRI